MSVVLSLTHKKTTKQLCSSLVQGEYSRVVHTVRHESGIDENMADDTPINADASADEHRGTANRRRFLQLAGAGAASVGLAGCLSGGGGGGGGGGNGGGSWSPSQTMRYIVPYDEGGGTDTYARGIVEAFTDKLGQNVQIDNIPGAGGLNGFGQLMQAQPDGHTILGSATPLEVAPQLLENPGFDQRDATGIGVFGSSTWTLVVNEKYKGEVKDLTDVIKKHNSGEWKNIGVQSPGSSQDIITLLAKYKFNDYDWQWENRVRYTGTGPVAEAVAKDEVPCGIGTDAGTRSVVENGSIYPATTFVSDGSPVYPDIPSVTDLGFQQMDFIGGLNRGMYAPPETPKNRRQVISNRLKQAVNDERTQQWSEKTGNPVTYEGISRAEEIMTQAFKKFNELNIIELVQQHSG